MTSARHANFNRAVILSLLMMMMTQVGYLESINPWTNGEETLDQANDVLESSGSGGFSLSPASTTVTLTNNTAMTPITYQYYSGSGMENGVPVGLMLGGGEYCNMEHAIDSNDKHHLIHYNSRLSGGLYYTTNSGGSWTTALIDSGANYLAYKSDIEVDSNNNPHVVYEAGSGGGLNYTSLSNGVWSTPTTIDLEAKNNPKLAIDSNDKIHVVSMQRMCSGCAANYTTNVGGSWVSEGFATMNNRYPYTADIALNSSGNVSIAYIVAHGSPSNNPQKSLTVYDKNGSTWDSEQIEFSQSLGYYKTEIQFDQYDVRHLYYFSSGHEVRNDASGAWSSNLCTNSCGASVNGHVADMKIEPNGTMHLVYLATTTSALKNFMYATNSTGSWAWEEIANMSTGAIMPTYDALELDSHGNLHYFFRDNSSFHNGTLYHLVENGVSTVGGSGSGSGSNSGIATVTITPGVSLGLVIALGA